MLLPPRSLADLPGASALARELLAIYGSPLYVYNAEVLHQTIQHITQSIPYANTQFCFASVTNGNISLLRIFQDQGWGLHANTPGDIYLGLEAGFNPEQIIYSGSNLNRAEMQQVLTWGIRTLNLDSLAQLQLCCEVWQGLQLLPLRLGLRLNLPELTGDSRIGVRPEEFATALEVVDRVGLQLTGLHFYRGTGTNATPAFNQAIATVLATARQLPDWQYLDFGGGFGYPYQKEGAAFDWPWFGRELTHHLEQLPRPIDLIIEPGRAAIAGSAILLARVVAVKWQGERQIVGVDTTVANLSVPAVHGGYREIIAFKSGEPLHPTDLCGNTTYSRDYLGRNCQLPGLQVGDIVGILDVGAYGYAMSSHFLHRPRPAEVLFNGNRHHLIRKREDYGVLLSHQVFE